MQAALVPMTSRQLGLLPTCMLMAAWYIILLAIGAVTALAAIKKRSKLYNRKQVYAVILACRLNDRRMKSKRGKRSDVKINLEPNLCKYVVLHRQHLTIDVFENLRTMIDKFSEYQNMVDMYVNIKETGSTTVFVANEDINKGQLVDFFFLHRKLTVREYGVETLFECQQLIPFDEDSDIIHILGPEVLFVVSADQRLQPVRNHLGYE
ncbi:unnamed protein product [Schistocephalus solidus]|uniref:HECT domain-containing protein n=1 Tax=Schistocephalus solidus TaxID=70667 RepID=A0A183SHH8_SCHSO|nr:unnamed protein product [Schistocephalus solidus]